MPPKGRMGMFLGYKTLKQIDRKEITWYKSLRRFHGYVYMTELLAGQSSSCSCVKSQPLVYVIYFSTNEKLCFLQIVVNPGRLY